MLSNSVSANAADYFSRVSHSHPVFVDETTVAYLDDSSGTNQVLLHDLETGKSTELTRYSEGILSLFASTATGTILYGLDRKGDERQQLYSTSKQAGDPIRITHDDNAFFEPGGMSGDGKLALYRTNSRDESIFDVAITNIDGKSSKIYLENGGQVLPQDLSERGALVIKSTGNASDDLLLVQEDGSVRNFTENLEKHRVYVASFDPSGEKAWIISERGSEFAGLHLLDLESGDFNLFFEDDWGVELVSASPDGKHLAISVNENGYSIPYIVSSTNVTEKRPVSCPRGVVDSFSWSPDSQRVVFGHSTSESPSKIYVGDLDGSTELLITVEEGPAIPTVTAKDVHFTTWDGREIPAYLYMPTGPGPHAALVEIHGGPESQRRPEYGSSGASIQYLVSRGIAVLALNIRGSIGYGREYRSLDDREKRLDALKDVEQAANWLGSQENISKDRIGVFGISYGGFMTLSALTRLPKLWAAGAEMVGMAHLETFLERTGPWRRPHREGEYGSLATDREMLHSVSPLPLVDQIETPLLVLHGRNDARVPLFESEQIVDAVSKRGIDVDLVIYEDEGHIFTKRHNLIDAYTRIGDFLVKHLRV